MPITDFLSCTRVFDEFESLSPAQRHHAKTCATGLFATSNKTVAGIAREILPANSKPALKKFLTEYDWDEKQFNHERLEEFRKHGETRWSKDGYVILDDTVTEKSGDEVPGVDRFYDHPKSTLSGAKTSSTPSTPTIKPPTHSPSASTKNRTKTTKTTIPSTISRSRSSPLRLRVRSRFWLF